VEVKLDERLVRKLEKYCQYLDSEREYVLSQALEIAFRKDREFGDWLASQEAHGPAQAPVAKPREKQA
jgi:predicted transcriptional regulator